MKIVRLALLFVAATAIVGVAGAGTLQTDNKGAPEMTLEGGKTGRVPFPHARHQAVLEDCAVCHSVFPQEAGAIDRLKAAGELQQKQVMNKQCTKCHKAFKQEGRPTGPTACKSCHIAE